MEEGWDGVPVHLLDSILGKLHSTVGLLRFSVVCSSWNRVTMHNIKSQGIEPYEYDHQTPMLLLPTQENDIWQVYNALDGTYSDFKLNLTHNQRFGGSSKGWLAKVNGDYTVTLLKPNFNSGKDDETIVLPPLFPPEDFAEPPPCEYHIHKTLITADPVLYPQECVIVAIFGLYREIAFLRLSTKDTISWAKYEEDVFFSDVLYRESRIYGLHYGGRLVSFDVDNPGKTLLTTSCLVHDYANRYLVEPLGSGKILQVIRYFEQPDDDDDNNNNDRVTIKFRVFSLGADNKWVVMKTIGEAALFLGDNSSISVRAADFPGCQPNCIYFTHDIDEINEIQNLRICDLGLYHIKTRKFELHYGIGSDTLLSMAKQPPIWIVPTIHL